MIVYLAGPINGCTDEEASGWRDELKPLLEAAGHEWLDPMRRDYRGREMEPGIAQKIVKGDILDIIESDAMIAMCPKPSVGTSMEIFYAHRELQMPVVVVIPDDGKDPSPWLVVHSDHIVRGSAKQALEYL